MPPTRSTFTVTARASGTLAHSASSPTPAATLLFTGTFNAASRRQSVCDRHRHERFDGAVWGHLGILYAGRRQRRCCPPATTTFSPSPLRWLRRRTGRPSPSARKRLALERQPALSPSDLDGSSTAFDTQTLVNRSGCQRQASAHFPPVRTASRRSTGETIPMPPATAPTTSASARRRQIFQ